MGWNMFSVSLLSVLRSSTLLASIFSKSREGLEILTFFFKLPRQILFLFRLVSCLSFWSLSKAVGLAKKVPVSSAFLCGALSTSDGLALLPKSSRNSSSLELDKSSPSSRSLLTMFNLPLSNINSFSPLDGLTAWFRFKFRLLLTNLTMRTSLTSCGLSLPFRCCKLRLANCSLIRWFV